VVPPSTLSLRFNYLGHQGGLLLLAVVPLFGYLRALSSLIRTSKYITEGDNTQMQTCIILNQAGQGR
jgi:hypothetical protein